MENSGTCVGLGPSYLATVMVTIGTVTGATVTIPMVTTVTATTLTEMISTAAPGM